MITINQDLWNLLFGWMREGQCMIPEGCTPPLYGLTFYITAILIIAGLIYWKEDVREKVLENVYRTAEIFQNLKERRQ